MITLVVDGISYQYPQVDDEDWGEQATLWASSVSDVLSSLRSPTLPTATSGKVRLGNTDRFSWRGFGDTFNVDLYVDVDDKLYVKIGANPPIDLTSAAAGNVTGPGSSTDNAVARYDGTTGQLIQDSTVIITDPGAVSGITSLAIGGTLTGATDVTASGTIQGSDLHATDDLTVDDDALVSGDLTVSGATVLNGNTTIGNAAGDTITITAATSSSVSGNFADAVGTAMTSTGANEVIDAYTRTTGTSVGARGVAISSSSGTFSSSSATYVDVTNLSVTITTSGRPVKLGLISATTTGNASVARSNINVFVSGGSLRAAFKFVRDSTDIAVNDEQSDGTGTAGLSIPSGSISHIDAVAAGTYTYKLQVCVSNASGTVEVRNCKLIAYEL